MSQRVLAIDDSPDIHRILDVRLGTEGLVIHHAFDAKTGMQLARDLLPDLILLDVDMPDVSGLELCRQLKDDQRTASIPVVFLTGAHEVYLKVQGFDLGAVDYITKPFEPAELRARVRSALRTKRYHDLLAMRAQIDALTGLWNRAYFDQRFSEEIAAAKRYGRPLTLMLLDVDHFKGVNDSHGHPFGDRVLQTIGEVLSATARATDLPCRYGGEEFAVLLTQTGVGGGEIAAERVRVAIAGIGMAREGVKVGVTVSVGVSSTEARAGGELTTTDVLAAADAALYASKHGGRNRVTIAGTSTPADRQSEAGT